MNLYQIDELIKLSIEKGITIDEETGEVTALNDVELNKLEWDKFGSILFEVDEILKKGYSTFAGNIGATEKINSNFKCDKTSNSLTINVQGDILVCCRDYNGLTKLGNVQTDKIKDIWEKHKGKDCRTIPFCQKCENRPK